MEKGVTINVAEFRPYYIYEGAKNVRHVDRSGLPQFTAKEETVIGLNESREVYRDFEDIGHLRNRHTTMTYNDLQ